MTANSMTSRRSVAAATRPIASGRGSLGQEAATSRAIAADCIRIASTPPRCCSPGAARSIARIIQSATPALGSTHISPRPSAVPWPRPLGRIGGNVRGRRRLAAQALPLLLAQHVVEALERQANGEQRVVHRPDSILNSLEPLRQAHRHGGGATGGDALDRARQSTAQLFKRVPLRAIWLDRAVDLLDGLIGARRGRAAKIGGGDGRVWRPRVAQARSGCASARTALVGGVGARKGGLDDAVVAVRPKAAV